MALLVTQSITSAGLAPATVSAAGGGDTIAPANPADDRTFLYVNNAGGSPITVSLADPTLTGVGNAGTVVPITVTNGTFKLIPIPAAAIAVATGLATVTYSAVTSVTVAALRR